MLKGDQNVPAGFPFTFGNGMQNPAQKVKDVEQPLTDIVPWQAIQDFYHKIVGKKESQKKRFTKPYQVKASDIEDLHHKLIQVAGDYPLITSSYTITTTYTDDSDTSVSSIEQFKLLSASGTRATREIELEYNFLIEHVTSKTQNNYKISVDIFSGIAVYDKIQKEVPKSIWSAFGYITGRANVEFVTYTVGQAFLNTISSWFESRSLAPSVPLFDWVQEKSEWIPRILRYLFLGLGAYVSVTAANKYIAADYNDKQLAIFLAIMHLTYLV